MSPRIDRPLRDIPTLMRALVCLIPKELEDVHKRVDDIQSSLDFAPPELQSFHFRRMGVLMGELEHQCRHESWYMNCEAVLMETNISDVANT